MGKMGSSDAFTRVISETVFGAFFDQLVDSAGKTKGIEDVKDARDRWWRWSRGHPEYVIRYGFTGLGEDIGKQREAGEGFIRFPALADFKIHCEKAAADLARKKQLLEEQERERQSRCETCGGLGLVYLVSHDGLTMSLDYYAFMRLHGGILMELRCACLIGERRYGGSPQYPTYSPGIMSPECPPPGSPGEHCVKKVPSGWLSKAVGLSVKLHKAKTGRADLFAEMLRLAVTVRGVT